MDITLRKLKPDKGFTPCLVDNGDELYPNGLFEFNISKLLEYIINHPDSVVLEQVKVSDLNHFSRINEAHISTVDLTRPILLAEISPGGYNVIDGNHRLEKALRLGIEKLPAYKISPAVHIKFLVSEKAYLTYIKYWNGKINDEIKRRKRWKI